MIIQRTLSPFSKKR